jgi:AraC family transcriptional regulator, chitin signaling transcriptional activator
LQSKITYILIFLGCAVFSYTQRIPEKGVPFMNHFTPEQYHNAGKVWQIASDPAGVVYMATDRGLLEFDGKNWKLNKGSVGITRSLLVVNDSLIYTGSDLDFGVWKKNRLNTFEYRSLYPFKNEAQDIVEEFWDIHRQADKIVFISAQNIYVFSKEQLIKFPFQGRISGSYTVNDKLYIADKKAGLFLFDGYKLNKLVDFPAKVDSEISGLYQMDSSLVIVTRDQGLYHFQKGKLTKLENTLSQKLQSGKVFCFEPVGTSYVAFGTILQGLYIADLNGKIIHHINRNKGLPVNTILSMHYPNCGKLWLGMDYGISAINLENRLTTFTDYHGDYGTANTALLKNGVFYLGTNQGLYRANWKELNDDGESFNFSLIPGTDGQVWTVEQIDNTLMMGHDKGLFMIRENAIEKIRAGEGVWDMIQYGDHLLAGNYNGISIFGKSDGKWNYLKKMDLIYGSCNQLIVEKEHILWINIPNFGVIRAELDKDLHPVERAIFPVAGFEGTNVFMIRGKKGIQVQTDLFRYRFDDKTKKFTRDGSVPDPKVPASPGSHQRKLTDEYSFYPVHNGFILQYLKDSNSPGCTDPPPLVFRRAEAFDNEKTILLSAGQHIPFHLNNIRINFIVPNRDNVLYQYKTEKSGAWSDWVSDGTFEFLNFKNGMFVLEVRAKADGKISAISTFSFKISPPWYRSVYAWVFYAIGAVLSGFALKKLHDISLRKQKEKLLLQQQNSLQKQAEKHREDIMLLEQMRLQGEYDQLKDQLKTKTVALAKKARENEEKNRLILMLKDKCELAQSNPNVAKSKWREMHRLLETYLEMEDKTFEIQMDELHQEFFRKLKLRFSDLSNNDLRMCAYLKIGLNSKEVSEILNIQPSSFYISRSRLRKKLNLKPSENLYDFLNAI